MDELTTIIIELVAAGIAGAISAFMTMGTYKNKVDTLGEDVRVMKDEIKLIRDKAVACETLLDERGPLTKRRSPVSLTDRGRIVLENSGGKKFVDDKIESLSGKVEEKNPNTAYDIQELSKEVIASMKDSDDFNIFKDYLFKEGLSIDDIVEVLSIYLRDKILELKHLQAEDVDKSSPLK